MGVLCVVSMVLTDLYTDSRIYSWGAYAKNEPEKVGETWQALLDMFAKSKPNRL